jgi:hypothetical protein
MFKTVLPFVLSASALALSSAAIAGNFPFNIHSQGVKTFAVFGDSPYGKTPTDTAEFGATPAFIDSINSDPDVSMVLHAGDIHSGHQYCTEAYDRSVFELWTTFQQPMVYTPGDNEWADCHKAKEGGGSYNAVTGQIDYKRDTNGNLINYQGGDPVDNLDLIRSVFFADPGVTLGERKLVLSQAQVFNPLHPTDSKYVENVMWQDNQTVFATLNIPGGSNNDSDPWYGAPSASAKQTQERIERSAADLRWLDAAFARAKLTGARAVVILSQADMWDLDGKPASHIAEYKPFIDRIAALTRAFGKPVLQIVGDSHNYRSDNPLTNNAACTIEGSMPGTEVACGDDAYDNQPVGYDVPNFHRIVVHGSTFPLEWLKLKIDPRAKAANAANTFGPFSWTRMMQPAQ